MMKKVAGAIALSTSILCISILCTSPAHAGSAAIQRFEPDSMARIVSAQNGKPFVLMIWSLDCEYCLASMKALAEEKRRRGGLHIVTLATDPVDDPESVALMRKKLHSTGLAGNAWAFGSAPAEQLRYAIDPKWHGEKPRSYWFNARGERVAYSGVITAETIARLAAR